MALFFRRLASCTKSGWRKPAVAHHPIVRGECNHSAKTDRHCRCGLHTHGGLTPAALACVFGRPLDNVRFSRHSVRFPNHGGLTPAAPDRMCVCTSQKSVFADRRAHRNARAGGVSPPWVFYRDCTSVREHTDGSLPRLCDSALASAFPKPTAGSRPPLLPACSDSRWTMFDSRGTAFGSPNHGGLTPAALACVFGQPLDNARFSRHSDRFTNHGGLTPAALVERASVQREWRYFSGDWRRAPGAAGVSQPWRTIGSCVVNVITPRKPLAVAGAVTEPRRADARRSFWARVCASKKSFFADERALCNARAGGVSPPWYVLGMRTRLRESHALPLQTRFAHPRRADARRSCAACSTAAEQCSILAAQRLVHRTTAG
jgi:hypothetical protein